MKLYARVVGMAGSEYAPERALVFLEDSIDGGDHAADIPYWYRWAPEGARKFAAKLLEAADIAENTPIEDYPVEQYGTRRIEIPLR